MSKFESNDNSADKDKANAFGSGFRERGLQVSGASQDNPNQDMAIIGQVIVGGIKGITDCRERIAEIQAQVEESRIRGAGLEKLIDSHTSLEKVAVVSLMNNIDQEENLERLQEKVRCVLEVLNGNGLCNKIRTFNSGRSSNGTVDEAYDSGRVIDITDYQAKGKGGLK